VQAARRVGLDRFIDELLDAAGVRMEYLYPDFATELEELAQREAADRSQALGRITVPVDSAQRFAQYRNLLTLTFDLDMALTLLTSALRLLGTRLDEASLAAISTGRGEWWLYHFQMWAYSLWGVLDRLRALIPVILRTLRRPYDPAGFEAAGRPLLNIVDALHERAGEIRHPLAHGATRRGGMVDAIAEQNLWEQLAVLRLWVPSRFSLDPLADNWQNDYRQARESTLHVLAAMVRVMDMLTDAIDWQTVKANAATGAPPVTGA
jgi:hypothetical protein